MLINRIPAWGLLKSSLPGSASRTHVELLTSLAMSTSVLKALPGKLDIKRRSPGILYLYPLDCWNCLGREKPESIKRVLHECSCIILNLLNELGEKR